MHVDAALSLPWADWRAQHQGSAVVIPGCAMCVGERPPPDGIACVTFYNYERYCRMGGVDSSSHDLKWDRPIRAPPALVPHRRRVVNRNLRWLNLTILALGHRAG